MSDDFTTRLREVAGLKEGCDPSTANILLGCAEYIERLQQRDVFIGGFQRGFASLGPLGYGRPRPRQSGERNKWAFRGGMVLR